MLSLTFELLLSGNGNDIDSQEFITNVQQWKDYEQMIIINYNSDEDTIWTPFWWEPQLNLNTLHPKKHFFCNNSQ